MNTIFQTQIFSNNFNMKTNANSFSLRFFLKAAIFFSFLFLAAAQSNGQAKGGNPASSKPAVNGCYFIEQYGSEDKVLDVANSSLDNGAAILLWDKHGSGNQRFEVLDAGGGYLYLKNVNSGKVATWQGRLQQADLSGSDTQKFKLIATDYPNAFYLAVKSEEQNDLALEATANGNLMLKGDGRSVMGGIRAQMFRFVPCGD